MRSGILFPRVWTYRSLSHNIFFCGCLLTKSCPTHGTPWNVACQAKSMEFSRHEYWSRLPFPFPVDLPDRFRDQTYCPSIGRRILYHWATKEKATCPFYNIGQENTDWEWRKPEEELHWRDDTAQEGRIHRASVHKRKTRDKSPNLLLALKLIFVCKVTLDFCR